MEDNTELAHQLTQEQEYELRIHPPPLNNNNNVIVMENLKYGKVLELRNIIDSIAITEHTTELVEEEKCWKK